MVKVKYLSKQQIELNADRLLADFGKTFGVVGQPPIPVEEILETHLKLTMEFDNLKSRLGFPIYSEHCGHPTDWSELTKAWIPASFREGKDAIATRWATR